MKLNILNIENNVIGEKQMPIQFKEELRPDLIKRAVHALQANRRHPYGAKEDAGKRASVYISKRRREYRGTYGIGQSRTPRKVMSRSGSRFNWVGAFSPNTVGGRRAHPPKSEKIWLQKINKKENKKAIRAAIAATVVKNIVKERGHFAPNNYPFIIESKIEDVKKTKDLRNILEKIGLSEELNRASIKKIRAGKGKLRGRKYRRKKGPLIVVSKDCNLLKFGKNIPGVEIVNARGLNAEILAPGAMQGRLTLWTENAVNLLEKKNYFLKMDPYKIIKNPVSTEKSIRMMESENKLLFVVDKKATKKDIKEAIETIFKTKVVDVATFNDQHGKKKAYVKFSAETPAIDIATDMGLM